MPLKASLTSRRRFVEALIAGVGSASLRPLLGMQTQHANLRAKTDHDVAPARDAAPAIINYSANGRPLLVEGNTLLASIKLPAGFTALDGSLPVKIEAETRGGPGLTESQPLYFYASRNPDTFYTILAAPLDVVPGTYDLNLSCALPDGRRSQWRFPYTFERGSYKHSYLTLSSDFSSPSPEIRARMLHDFETMVEIYHRRSPRYWKLSFILPTQGSDRHNFGDKRTVNGTKHYSHAGLDFHAPIGTPILAVNDGLVVLATEQWTPGQTVCIDHGGGVFSKYLHLSERRVFENDRTTRGQVLGLSGNTGGQHPAPHLHLDMVVSGIHVNPITFMNTAALLREHDKSS